MSVLGQCGFCSDACRNPQKRNRSNFPPDAGTPPEQPQSSTKDEPVGSIVHKLFWFSITAGKGNSDIEHGELDPAAKWLDTFCVRGGIATERGTKKRLLHLQ